jgi:hypothetical protein
VVKDDWPTWPQIEMDLEFGVLPLILLCITIAHRRVKLTQEEDRKTYWGGIIASSFRVLHRADRLLRFVYNAAFDSTQTLLKLNVLHEISSKSVICGSHDVIDRYLIES